MSVFKQAVADASQRRPEADVPRGRTGGEVRLYGLVTGTGAGGGEAPGAESARMAYGVGGVGGLREP